MIGVYVGLVVLVVLVVLMVLIAHQRTGFAGLGPRRWRVWLKR